MSDLLKWLGLPASILLFTWACFVKLDPLLRAKPRLALVAWLLGQRSDHTRWTAVPVALFDRLLARNARQTDAPPLFVRPSVRRSLVLTVISIALVTLLGPAIGTALCADARGCSERGFFRPLLEALPHYGTSIVAFLFLANAAIDYVCLVKTRLLLGLGSRARSTTIALAVPILDMVLTFLAWNVLFDFALLAWGKLSGIEVTVGVNESMRDLIQMYLHSVLFRSSDLFNIFLWSTVLTMIWMLAFVLGVTAVKLLSAAQRLTAASQRFFNLDDAILDKPLAVVGIAVGIILLAVAIAAKALSLIIAT